MSTQITVKWPRWAAKRGHEVAVRRLTSLTIPPSPKYRAHIHPHLHGNVTTPDDQNLMYLVVSLLLGIVGWLSCVDFSVCKQVTH